MAKVYHMARASKIIVKALKVDFNGFDPAKGLPERMKIFNWGRNETLKGPVIVDKDSVGIFECNQKKIGRETLPIDFNHNTVQGEPAYDAAKGSPEIAGYARARVIENDGVYLEGVSTTPSGMSKGGDYKDLSPVPLLDEKTGRLIGLHSVALTPTGATDGLTMESAKLQALSATFKTLSVSLLDARTKEKSKPAGMTSGEPDYYPALDEEIMNEEHLKTLRSAMGVNNEMSWDDLFPMIVAKLGSGKEGPITPTAKNESITWPGAFEYKVMEAITKGVDAKLQPLNAKLEALTTELATKNADLLKQRKDTIIAEAGKAGKVITLSAPIIASLSVEALEEVIKALPDKQVPTNITTKVLEAPRKEKLTRADSSRLINERIQSLGQPIN